MGLMRKKVIYRILTLSCVCFLGACGKKGGPTVPENQEDFYPMVYPPVEAVDQDNSNQTGLFPHKEQQDMK